MKVILFAATLLTATAAAFAVNAATDTVTSASPETVTWMPVGEVAAKLEAQGYQILEIERDDDRYYEVEMRDVYGYEVEAYLDAATGEPVPHMSDTNDDYSEKGDD
ncbi:MULTISPECIES: PepSY domain-containing protein [unclassified Ruegeria]|jgi:hypothetical protein|uniref:PepSY domain-containing protein n=1 Tax=unclassified Ruegeria TaxID=2625375 RepID=UPI0014911072|nr:MULTISPECIES: PepSY domain-containing protein [unclassified Ruegeria]MBO9448264.1 PepSY domain-containing protein [Ruegeria sp. R14_0]NOD90804.1 PepSY domain-containing protein [Ruegeria sp. HKCCD4318]NOE16106.1 PepSY domain-containing protein [Ruegeria sp. HKCCD4318-2]NOG11640.1 PepSY domain-containing protein [Ruegeria sp. HKCCD4315]UUV08524.1 PepSY domain-containing protein [Ruegeria sp. YS9]